MDNISCTMTSSVQHKNIGVIRSSAVDNNLILLPFAVGILAWGLVHWEANWFWPILVLDLWLLGYHHVIATFTRFGRDPDSGRLDSPGLWFGTAFIIFAGVLFLTMAYGIVAVTSIYLYWQFWHYLRQGEGIFKAFLAGGGASQFGQQKLFRALFYGIAFASFLTMLSRAPATFLKAPVWIPAIPNVIPILLWVAVGVLALALGLKWRTIPGAENVSTRAKLFFASYVAVFVIGYAATEDLNHGWLLLNIWHNFQYLIFVWIFNSNMEQKGLLSHRQILSYMSKPRRVGLYFLITFTISTLIYYFIDYALIRISGEYWTVALVLVYQTINFHHYVVDTKIWKLKKRSVGSHLVRNDA